MTPVCPFERAAQHYTRLAMVPGYWAHARHQARELEADAEHQSGLFDGLVAEVRKRIAAAGFKPHPAEVGEWWVVNAGGMA